MLLSFHLPNFLADSYLFLHIPHPFFFSLYLRKFLNDIVKCSGNKNLNQYGKKKKKSKNGILFCLILSCLN